MACVRTVYDARPDGVCFKDGRTPFSSWQLRFFSLFLYSFLPKNRDVLKSSRPTVFSSRQINLSHYSFLDFILKMINNIQDITLGVGRYK